MARIKEGLDYFSLDVNMNDKMEMVEAEYGLKAFAIMIKLFQKIYSKGYYLKWDEKQKLLFKKCVNEDLEFIESIINSALKWGVFNEQIFQDYSILTSTRIQKNYIEATKRRSSVQLITQLILVNETNENCHYVDINGENVNIKQKKENILTQRKGKEKKGNKSKGKEGDFSDDFLSAKNKIPDYASTSELNKFLEKYDINLDIQFLSLARNLVSNQQLLDFIALDKNKEDLKSAIIERIKKKVTPEWTHFVKMYPKKESILDAKELFTSLDKETQHKILDTIPNYDRDLDKIKYAKKAHNYIETEAWRDYAV